MTCKPGTLVLQSPVYAHVIASDHVDQVCDNCLLSPNIYDNVEPVKLSRCSQCKQSYYCNSSCQKQAWRLHKVECKYLARIAPRSPPSIVKLMLRICFRHKAEPEYKETLPDGSVRIMSDLKQHREEITADQQRSEAFSSFLPVMKACVGDMFTVEELLSTYCRVLINCTEITDDMGSSVGTGLYLGMSAVDHSCSPNVNVVFNKTMVELRSMTEIPVPEWQHVRVSYLNTVTPRAMRQSRLEQQYYFSCQCPRCESDSEQYCEGSLVCRQCQCPVSIRRGKCDNCNCCVTNSDIPPFPETRDMSNSDLLQTYSKLQTVFHIYDYRMVELTENVLSACLRMNEYKMFLAIGEKLLKAYDEYFHPKSVSYGLHLAKLAKVAIYLNKPSEATEYLNKCFTIFRNSYGDNSLIVTYLFSLRDSISL